LLVFSCAVPWFRACAMGAKELKLSVMKETPARNELAPTAKLSLANAEGVSVRWPRSAKPLVMLGLLTAIVVAIAAVMQAYHSAVVRAPGVLYPATRSALHAPLSNSDRRGCRVAEVYKHAEETVQAGEKLLRLDSSDEELQREQAQEQVQACRQALRDHELRRLMAATAETAVDPGVKRKVLERDLERARLEERRINRAIEEKVLRAPRSGVLHEFQVQAGDWISSKDALGRVCDTSSLFFCAQVQQRDLSRIRLGQRARVYFGAHDGGNGAYEAEVAEIGTFLDAAANESSDPLGLFLVPPPRVATTPCATVRLKVLRAVGRAPEENGAGDPPASAGNALRPGCAGQARILVGEGRMAEWLFSLRPLSAAPTVYHGGTRNKGGDQSVEPTKKKKKATAQSEPQSKN